MKKRKKIFKLIILVIFLSAILLLFFNKTTIKMYNRCKEYYKLKTDLKFFNTENINIREALYQLKNNPNYIKKATKAELEVIEEGEILYIFDNKENETKN